MTDTTKTYAEKAYSALKDATDDAINRLVTEKLNYEFGFSDFFIHLQVYYPHILREILENELKGSMKENIEQAMKMAKLTLE